MITCAEAVSQLWNYLDRSLNAVQRKRVEEHLGLCRQCCGELEFARVLQGFLADHAEANDLPGDVRARMQKFVEDLQL